MPRRRRLKLGDVLKEAFRYAIQDREGLIDAYSGDESEQVVRDAQDLIKAIKYLDAKLFRRNLAITKGHSAVNVTMLRSLVRDNMEIPDE